eukprot:12327843-Prorocentrum_lima.AAC.1
MRRVGAFVDLERPIPELARLSKHRKDEHGNPEVEEAIMDLHILWPGATAATLIDVTVRTCQAGRYRHQLLQPGIPSATAEHEKFERYGSAVDTWAME